MPPAAYSFIDVAVLSEVRKHFADGCAIVILSTDLAEVIWANGPGAAILGNTDIEAVIGESSGLSFAARRQIASTRGFPHIGSERSVTVRLNQGIESRAVGFLASEIAMPDGEDAIMLVAPASDDLASTRQRAASVISGFSQPGHLVALLDARGGIEAASSGFDKLGISPQALADLVRDVARDSDRLVKKIISGATSKLPAGIARLRDDPATHLLMVIDEQTLEEAEAAPLTVASEDAADAADASRAGSTAFVQVDNRPMPIIGSTEPDDTFASTVIAAGQPQTETTIADWTVAAVATPFDDSVTFRDARTDTIEPALTVDLESPADETTVGALSANDPQERAPADHGEHVETIMSAPGEPQTTIEDRTKPLEDYAEDRGASANAITVEMQPDAAAAADIPRSDTILEAEAALIAVDGGSMQIHAMAGPADDAVTSLASTPDGARDTIEISDNIAPADPKEATSVAGIADEAPEPAADALPEATVDVQSRQSAAAVRFAWRTDADGRFSALSHEFVEAVGDAAGDVLGRSFSEVAATLGLDPKGEIGGLLARRDTWSGRQVLWPIAGTDLKVPVDLAALPAYSRDRSFEGFRGFGVARMADVIMDPEAIGLRLASDGTIEAFTAASVGLIEGLDHVGDAAPDSSDPFKGEVPALTIVPQPDRRLSDKIIKLAEHRPGGPERNLSPVEKIAFREIGERLKKAEDTDKTVSKPSTEPAADAAEPSVAEPETIMAGEPADDASVSPFATGPDPSFFENEADAQDHVSEVLEAGEAESDAPEKPVEHDLLTADLFEGETADETQPVGEAGAAQTEAVVAQNDDGASPGEPPSSPERKPRDEEADAASFAAEVEALIVEEEYQPSDFEGWSELTPPVEEAIEEIDESRPAEHEPESGGPEIAYPTTEPAPVSDVERSSEDSREKDAKATELPVDELAGVDVPAQVQEDYEPSNFEGWSELTLPVDEAIEEARSADPKAEIGADHGDDTRPDAAEAGEDRPVAGGRAVQDTTILARLPVPILIHSGDTLHYANEEFLDLTGYESVEGLADVGGLGALFADTYQEDAADGADRSLRLRTADGQEFPIEALLRAVPWQGSRALMLVVRRAGETEAPLVPPVLEVSERDDLKSRLAEMRTIIDTATDGVILIGNDGMIRSISRPAEALFSYEDDEIHGKPFVSLFAMESQRAARDYLDRLSDNGVGSVLNDGREVIGREAEGRFIPLFMSIGRLPNDTGFCAVLRDLTQWKRAEEELTHARSLAERASSQKSDFLARISHEIRTPLNAIIGFSELMMDERFGSIGNERYRDYLRDINRSGNHVLDLVNDLLDISKIEAGEQEMAHEAVSLNETISQSVAMMQPQANRERVIIRSSLASKLPDVVADLRSVRQIALNLLSNAIRYTQAGGQVIVSTSYEPSGEVVMRIRDTGIGMTQAEIEQALKPFKQINALKRTRGDGTGLGLPLTKAMVEANRARFSISSTPGDGTLVEVTFPSARVLAR